MSRGIVTLAYGARHRGFAAVLARSLELHCPEIPRAIVTDAVDERLARLYAHRIPLDPARGQGHAQKLWLREYSPFEQTVYIDADCLAVRDLGFLWSLFAGHGFAAIGDEQTHLRDGEWWGDIAERCRRFELDSVPQFNGGFYYFDASPEAARVFADSRALAERYDELGFRRLSSGVIADEPLVSVAMARNPGAALVDDGGRVIRTPLDTCGDMHVDVLRGTARMVKEREGPIEPAIVHFCRYWTGRFEYRRERLKLALVARGLPAGTTSSLIDSPAATARAAVRSVRRTGEAINRLR